MRPNLILFQITAIVDVYSSFGDHDGPIGKPTRSREEYTVCYAATSQAIAMAYYHAVWEERHPEIRSIRPIRIDALIQATRFD